MSDHVLRIHDLTHTYLAGTPMEATALTGASLSIEAGEIHALVGPSGAGKSTLAHYASGVISPGHAGHVYLFGQDTADPATDLAELRRHVGLVFQYPHVQLLERYVGDDIAYGLRREGLPRDVIRERVREAMGMVGLEFAAFKDRHTFGLSGGEMRRVAIAGALAVHPALIVLDEATTGLDPRSRRETQDLLMRLRDGGTSTLLVSNDMDEVVRIADRVTVVHQGATVSSGPPEEVFRSSEQLAAWGICRPLPGMIVDELAASGVRVSRQAITIDDAVEAIWQAMKPSGT